MNEFLTAFKEMFAFENVKWDAVLEATYETIYMTVIATALAFIIGLILGIILFLSKKNDKGISKPVYGATSFIVNLFRAIPFIILIILIMPFTKAIMGTVMGSNGALPALIIGAAPFFARLVEIGLKEIDKGVIEAAESMGANTWTLIWKVLIPESLPALISGITVTSIMLVGSTAIAGVIGAGGLGNLAYMVGFTRNQPDVTLVATVVILVIVFIIQIIGDTVSKAVDKR
ncbi:ABC transporter permease [Jeotgalicoccus coquinae]|uniref:D-methionine transport system permease protein n=1 Tax=Jeotgalicoccus coquinae TaxID=709509 RepID=A0A6V7RL61_9STAP|nr:methionine ABC transporter permease [Jeotgalicoccus coquinae]MBB6422326.1 D-methionine transport system permease protein [Jeotgalicoccus coquinae]GGE16786.1 ABC transporter permease [Jeotgalicoccus coquinae]CAD2078923.1 Methionine import system permease protein MetP [Jeotgalicoccus coquinae]